MTAPAASNLYRELWISFASLIRSYVAAHDIGRPVGRALIDEGEGGHLTLRSDDKILTLEFDDTTGTGIWAIYEDDPAPLLAEWKQIFAVRDAALLVLEDGERRLLEHDGDLSNALGEPLAGADIEGHTSPAPVFNLEP